MKTYSNCEFDFVDYRKLYQSVLEAQKNKNAFSFVRLGDGEGALLDFNYESEAWLVDYLSTHFGRTIKLHQILEIRQKLLSTVKSADMIGTRDDIIGADASNISHQNFLSGFTNAFKLRDTEKNLKYVDAQRIFKLYNSLRNLEFKDETLFTSVWDIYDFFLSGALPSLLMGCDSIGLVNSNPAVAEAMRKGFRKNVVYIETNDKYEITGNKEFKPYPDSYDNVVGKINDSQNCQIYIVAAGLIGKSYCEEIRKKGSIALDLGALVDSWVGKFTRPRVLKSRFDIRKSFFRKKNLVPTELILTPQNVDRLVNTWNMHKSKTVT